MKNKLSNHIQYLKFDEEFFNDIYQKNPDIIKYSPNLLFKSLKKDNAKAFLWLLKKVDIEPVFNRLIDFSFGKLKNRNFAFYKLLKKSYPDTFNKNINKKYLFSLFCGLLELDRNKKRILKYIREIVQDFTPVDSSMLDVLNWVKEFEDLVIEQIKLGAIPKYKDQFFQEFCTYGNPIHLQVFKNLGCDIHANNEVALMSACYACNEDMVKYLIDNEKADLSIHKYYPIFILLNLVDGKEIDSSDDMISYLANKAYENNYPKNILKKFIKNNKFKISYEYYSTKASVEASDIKNTSYKKSIIKI